MLWIRSCSFRLAYLLPLKCETTCHRLRAFLVAGRTDVTPTLVDRVTEYYGPTSGVSNYNPIIPPTLSISMEHER